MAVLGTECENRSRVSDATGISFSEDKNKRKAVLKGVKMDCFLPHRVSDLAGLDSVGELNNIKVLNLYS